MPSHRHLPAHLALYFVTSLAIAQESSISTADLFERVNPSVCTVVASDSEGNPGSLGSGFILRDSRLLVTNAHVVNGYSSAEVKCGDQYASITKIVKYREGVDLVVAETDPINIEGLNLSTESDVKPGTPVFAFGSPLGLEGTISPGLASGQRQVKGERYIQISAPISSGSSGGPVTDEYGSVVAVTVASLEAGQNLNFAIPAAIIRELPAVELTVAQLTAMSTPQTALEPSQPREAPGSAKPGMARSVEEPGNLRGVRLLFCENQKLRNQKEVYYELDFDAGTFIWQDGWQSVPGVFGNVYRIKKIDETTIHFDSFTEGKYQPELFAYLDRRTLVFKMGRTPYNPGGYQIFSWQCRFAPEKRL